MDLDTPHGTPLPGSPDRPRETRVTQDFFKSAEAQGREDEIVTL